MRAVHWRAWAATTMEYLSLALTVVVTVLAWVAASIWPSLATPAFFVIAALAGLALGLAISLVYLRRALRQRYLCGGPLGLQGLWVCPMLAIGRPFEGGPPPGAREVTVHGVPPVPKPLPSLRVLVVEDDAVARHIMVRVLENAGFEVEATDDGAHALYILGHQRPDVMVLDLMLPTLNGEQVARAQHALEASYGRSARIVVVTGRPDAQREAAELGAEIVLPKPVDGAQLVRAVTGSAPASRPGEVSYESEPRHV